jgi:hypothetical protein
MYTIYMEREIRGLHCPVDIAPREADRSRPWPKRRPVYENCRRAHSSLNIHSAEKLSLTFFCVCVFMVGWQQDGGGGVSPVALHGPA